MSELILKVIPFWLFGLLLVFACVIASEVGRVVRRRLPSRPDADFPSDIQGYVVGAVFGLLALLMALTFSIAVNRYDERRGWVAQEANAINTTFLRASLLDEPFRTQIQSTLRMYAHSRISPDGIWDERMNARLTQSHQLQDRLWSEAHAALYPIRTTELASYFVVSLNETLDIGTRRELAGRTHIPARIFNSLLLYLLGASFILGFVTGSGSIQARLTFAVLFILFAIAIMMIVDLDSAQAGAIRVPQTAMKDLVTALDKVKLEPGRAK